MELITSIILMTMGINLGMKPDTPDATENLTQINHSMIQQNSSGSKVSKATNIAQSRYCDLIRAANNRMRLGLKDWEIEALGFGKHLRMSTRRIEAIHQKLRARQVNLYRDLDPLIFHLAKFGLIEIS